MGEEQGESALMVFQSTHLHEVRLRGGSTPPCSTWFQSTHLHEVRPTLAQLATDKLTVSIHAPT